MSRCKGNDMFLYFVTESLHSCGECHSCGGREELQSVGVEAQGKSHIRPDAGDAGRLGDKPPQPFAVDALQQFRSPFEVAHIQVETTAQALIDGLVHVQHLFHEIFLARRAHRHEYIVGFLLRDEVE